MNRRRIAMFGLLVSIGIVAVIVGMTLPASQPEKANADTGTFEFSGMVVDPDGKPFAGARLYLVHEGTGDSPVAEVRDISGVDGTFRINGNESEFLQSSRGFGWRTVGIVVTADGYGAEMRHVICFDDPENFAKRYGSADPIGALPFLQRNTTFRLREDDVPLEGRIVSRDGRPVADAVVQVLEITTGENDDLKAFFDAIEDGEDWDVVRVRGLQKLILHEAARHLISAAHTDEEGRFRLSGVGRDRVVKLLIQGSAIETQEVYAVTRNGPAHRIPHLLETPNRETFTYYGAKFEHSVRESIPIVGYVRDKETSQPLAGATIRCLRGSDQHGGIEHIYTTSNEQGWFSLTGVPIGTGRPVIALPPPDQPYLNSWKRVDVEANNEVASLDFELLRGLWIRGRVTDSAGLPVRGKVEYHLSDDNPQSRVAADYLGTSNILGGCRTDADGRYAIPGLPGQGRIGVLAFEFGRYARGADGFNAVADVDLGPKTLNHDFKLDSGATLTGQLLDDSGNPLSGAHFDGQTQSGSDWRPLTGSDFTVDAYRENDTRTLLFVHKERKLAGGRVLKGSPLSPLIVRLRPWGVITGRIVDDHGKPIEKALVLNAAFRPAVRPEHGVFPERHYLTDEAGRFQIEGLAPGIAYDIWITSTPGDVSTIGQVASDVVVNAGELKNLGDLAATTYLVPRQDDQQGGKAAFDKQPTAMEKQASKNRQNEIDRVNEIRRQASEKARKSSAQGTID